MDDKVYCTESFEESNAVIYINSDDSYDVYETPQYGGEEVFLKNFTDLNEAIDFAENLT